MCDTVIQTKYPKARKDHTCDACYWLCQGLEFVSHNLSFREKRAIVRARRNGWKIKKGETYVRATVKQDGELATFRAIPEIDQICTETGLYSCD